MSERTGRSSTGDIPGKRAHSPTESRAGAPDPLPGSRAMPRLCQGVLVSLIPGSRKEMRDVRDAVAHGRLIDVPNVLRAMKRL